MCIFYIQRLNVVKLFHAVVNRISDLGNFLSRHIRFHYLYFLSWFVQKNGWLVFIAYCLSEFYLVQIVNFIKMQCFLKRVYSFVIQRLLHTELQYVFIRAN